MERGLARLTPRERRIMMLESGLLVEKHIERDKPRRRSVVDLFNLRCFLWRCVTDYARVESSRG